MVGQPLTCTVTEFQQLYHASRDTYYTAIYKEGNLYPLTHEVMYLAGQRTFQSECIFIISAMVQLPPIKVSFTDKHPFTGYTTHTPHSDSRMDFPTHRTSNYMLV